MKKCPHCGHALTAQADLSEGEILRDSKVLELRLRHGRMFKEIGDELGVTSTRARQIFLRAVERHPDIAAEMEPPTPHPPRPRSKVPRKPQSRPRDDESLKELIVKLAPRETTDKAKAEAISAQCDAEHILQMPGIGRPIVNRLSIWMEGQGFALRKRPGPVTGQGDIWEVSSWSLYTDGPE